MKTLWLAHFSTFNGSLEYVVFFEHKPTGPQINKAARHGATLDGLTQAELTGYWADCPPLELTFARRDGL